MKKLSLTIIVTFIFSLSLFAQNIEKLDEKNGFKDLKLGDSYSKWQQELNYDGTWEDGSKAYEYIGNCCSKLFDYPIEKIILRFSNNKLIGIRIFTEKFQEKFEKTGEYTKWRTDDFKKINSSFTYLFGEHTILDEKNDSYIWSSKKVMLISKYDYLGVKNGDRQQIFILDKSNLKSGINEGF